MMFTTVRERLEFIELMEKLNKNPKLKEELGIELEMKIRDKEDKED